jgi:hypothetical protein
MARKVGQIIRRGDPIWLVRVPLAIPTKANAVPGRIRTAFRDSSEHPSERSDAGLRIPVKWATDSAEKWATDSGN